MAIIRRRILTGAPTAILLRVLFPPISESTSPPGGRRHAGLGHDPFWAKPSSLDAYRALAPGNPNPPPEEILRSYEARFNAVHFTAKLLGILIAFGLPRVLTRKRKAKA
ncbi:MAG: hypothetical protein GYA74_11575 [Acidobacteria bacterium]|nr:hypothetical protein [Acidobacteriota bacterium]NMD11803.1 hypothetical protein [Acidobacteriota bacterium]